MRSILFFAIALLIICSTIEAQRGRKGKTKTCVLKYQGKITKLSGVPRNCCRAKKRGKRQSSASKCAAYCPIIHKLKGCEFMCHFDHCKDKCQAECGGGPNPGPTPGPTDDSTTEGSGVYEY